MRYLVLIATLALHLGIVKAASDDKIPLEFCHIDNFSEEVLCGSYTVEENRQQPNGRTIDIQVAVLPAVSEAKESDPFVLFAGGPGQGARAMGRYVQAAFRGVNETRDIVLIDQRGMGDSAPLTCEMPEADLSTMDSEAANEAYQQMIKDCASNLEADVAQYTQDIANQDIHDILVALGYDKVNLYGASWGTRSALLYANQYPEQVRSVTIDGTAPLSNKVPLYFTRDAEATIKRLLKDCAEDAGCAEAFADLDQRFDDFLNNFPAEGIATTIADPNTGKLIEVNVSKDAVLGAIRTILYSPVMTRMLPLAMEKMLANDFRPLAGILSGAGDAGMTLGATLTILCAEEFSRFTEAEMAERAQDGFEAGTFTKMMYESCQLWPKVSLPEIYAQTLVQQVPTLILSGDLDPVTPPYWGEEMKVHFPNSMHLIAPNTGHNVAPAGCAKDLIAEFVTTTQFDGIDASCLDDIQRPTFFLNSSGPVGRASE